jgi:uncharacterized membrane protein (DUF373 family)
VDSRRRSSGNTIDVTDEPRPLWRAANEVSLHAELAIYVIVSVILIAGAAVLVGQSVYSFFEHVDDGLVPAATELLSTLLLVFVFIELAGAVRTIVREERLIAEPFLLVGIIASIKEIVVIAGAETPEEEWERFRNAMVEIGALAGVALVLAIAALLLRRREREPSEERR